MQTETTVIARPVEDCWRLFNEPASLVQWVPGLRAAELLERREDGLPAAIQFVFGRSLFYSLVYTYDLEQHVVSWQPTSGNYGAVRGFAQFTTVDGGTQVTYGLEHEPGRKALDRAIDNPRTLVEAFARYLYEAT